MKKSTSCRLMLHRETLAALGRGMLAGDLAQVKGGGPITGPITLALNTHCRCF